jgi:hypothetical protein
MANATSVGSGWGAGMNGPGVATPKPARTYTNPMNDPNSPRYWANKPQAQVQTQPGNAGSGWGLPGATTPQITQSPFQGQAGPSYQTHLPGQLGPGGMMPNPVPYPGIGQTGTGYGMGNHGGGMGWQTPSGGGQGMGYTQQAPTGPNSMGSANMSNMNPQQLAEYQRIRQLMLQQQASGQGGQMTSMPTSQTSQIQPMAQPFQQTNPWQQQVPKNFNQGNAYNPFVRAW